MLYLHYINN